MDGGPLGGTPNEQSNPNRGGHQPFFALASAKQKKSKKSESAKGERKKLKLALFLPSHTGSPVPEPKYAQQGEKQRVLSKMYSTLC